MDTRVAKDVIGAIRSERDSRLAHLRSQDPDVADDLWLFRDEPLISELCLMLLVATWHYVERELVWAAGRVAPDDGTVDGDQYLELVRKEGKRLGRRRGLEKLAAKLGLSTVAEWTSSMQTLRLVANSYKHDPQATPGKSLLEHLHLDLGLNYAPLSESQALKAGLSTSLDLHDDADFCDITQELLSRAEGFLAEVQQQPGLRPVKWGPVSLNPEDFLY